ncbi:MAG: hypothetical protein K9H84_00040 [Bacteroidales bacterium]|nr:hypothetical protein [Bacteroidales bacterium]
MKKCILISLLMFIVLGAGAQKAIIPGNFDNFFIDALGNFYTIKGNTVQKYNSAGIKTEEFTSFINGSISWLDVSNPLKILVYYQSFDQVLFLDKYFSVRSKVIDLTEYGIISSQASALAYDNGIWVYDQSAGKIIRLDKNLAVSHESSPLQLDTYARVEFIYQSGEHIFFALDKKLLVFDRFGSFDKSIPLPDHQALTWAKKTILYISNQQLIHYDVDKHQVKTVSWPYDSTKNIRYSQNLIYYQNNKGIFRAKI